MGHYYTEPARLEKPITFYIKKYFSILSIDAGRLKISNMVKHAIFVA